MYAFPVSQIESETNHNYFLNFLGGPQVQVLDGRDVPDLEVHGRGRQRGRDGVEVAVRRSPGDDPEGPLAQHAANQRVPSATGE